MARIKMGVISNFYFSRISILFIFLCLMITSPISVNASYQKKIDKLSRECQAGKEKSCIKLAEIAKNDKNWQARYAAVEKLNDQALLAEIAKTDNERSVRKVAVEKLTDQAVLIEIVKTDKESNVRQAVLNKITDQALLAEIAKTDKSIYVGKAAIEKLSDQPLLAEIAKSNSDVNSDALSKILDMKCLLDVAQNATNVEIREDATEKLRDDPKAIVEVVKTEPDWHAKFIALSSLRDESFLAIIAKERLITSIDIERGKLQLLPGETVRTEIRTGRTVETSLLNWTQDKKSVIYTITIKPGSVEFEGNTITDAPTLAAMRLSDQVLLTDVARNAYRASARQAAVEKLTDKTILIKISNTDKDINVRKEALDRLKQLKEK